MIKTNYINEKLNCKKSLPTQKCLVTVLRQLPAANTYCALPRQLLTIRERRRSRSATCHMRPILGNSSSLARRTPFTNQQYAFACRVCRQSPIRRFEIAMPLSVLHRQTPLSCHTCRAHIAHVQRGSQ